MKASLGDILGGVVEIPADVRHYQVKDGERLVHSGQADDIAGDLWSMFKCSDSPLGKSDNWTAVICWTVEWEENGKVAAERRK